MAIIISDGQISSGISLDGTMHISSGGIVHDVTINTGNIGNLLTYYGACVTYADSVDGVYWGSANTLLSHAQTMQNKAAEFVTTGNQNE